MSPSQRHSKVSVHPGPEDALRVSAGPGPDDALRASAGPDSNDSLRVSACACPNKALGVCMCQSRGHLEYLHVAVLMKLSAQRPCCPGQALLSLRLQCFVGDRLNLRASSVLDSWEAAMLLVPLCLIVNEKEQ